MQYFGIPSVASSDNGVSFQSRLWSDLHDSLGTIVTYSPLYSPQSVGIIERQHKDIKQSLKACLITVGEEYQHKWSDILPWILLGRRTSHHSELGTTPAQVLFGEDPPLPGELRPLHQGETLPQILDKVKANVNRPLQQTDLHRDPKVYMPPSTQTAKLVMTKVAKPSPLGPAWDGPFRIVERLGDSALKLKVGHYANGQERTEIRHWNTCYPLDPNTPLQEAVRPFLGRKPNVRTAGFAPDQEMETGLRQD